MKSAEKNPGEATEKQLAATFTHYRCRRLSQADTVKAAVLCPLFTRKDQVHLLFIKRSQSVKKHKGEISFPGGVQEKSDSSLLATCLRETEEEVGIGAGDIRIIGRLDDVYTTTGYVVSPFLGLIPYPYPFRLCSREVDFLLPVPLATLADEVNQYEFFYFNGRKLYDLVAYRIGGEIIWGATAKIVARLLQLLQNNNLLPPG